MTNGKKRSDQFDNELKELKRWREGNPGDVSLAADNSISITAIEATYSDMFFENNDNNGQYIINADDYAIPASTWENDISEYMVRIPSESFNTEETPEAVGLIPLPEEWKKIRLQGFNKNRFVKK